MQSKLCEKAPVVWRSNGWLCSDMHQDMFANCVGRSFPDCFHQKEKNTFVYLLVGSMRTWNPYFLWFSILQLQTPNSWHHTCSMRPCVHGRHSKLAKLPAEFRDFTAVGNLHLWPFLLRRSVVFCYLIATLKGRVIYLPNSVGSCLYIHKRSYENNRKLQLNFLISF